MAGPAQTLDGPAMLGTLSDWRKNVRRPKLFAAIVAPSQPYCWCDRAAFTALTIMSIPNACQR
jgi:hypothetical protein